MRYIFRRNIVKIRYRSFAENGNCKNKEDFHDLISSFGLGVRAEVQVQWHGSRVRDKEKQCVLWLTLSSLMPLKHLVE